MLKINISVDLADRALSVSHTCQVFPSKNIYKQINVQIKFI